MEKATWVNHMPAAEERKATPVGESEASLL
jgi:hypothetical protein